MNKNKAKSFVNFECHFNIEYKFIVINKLNLILNDIKDKVISEDNILKYKGECEYSNTINIPELMELFSQEKSFFYLYVPGKNEKILKVIGDGSEMANPSYCYKEINEKEYNKLLKSIID